MRRLISKIPFILLSVILSAGCTRNIKKDSLSVRVPVPQKVGSLEVFNLDIAIVNVHIPGQPTRVVKRENHGSNPSTIAPGSEIVLEVPNVPPGQSAFVQVLAVYGSNDSGAMKFYYGDQAVQTGSNSDVFINAQQSGTSSGTETQIFGRYLTAANAGPTGTLEMLFEVGGGKPAMTVEKSVILNGWFQAFAVEGAKFDLRIAEAGTTLFDDLTLDDATGDLIQTVAGTPTSIDFNVGHRMRMLKPLTFRQRENGDAEPSPESYLVLGFFDGSNDTLASSKVVVYPNVVEGLSGIYADSSLTTLVNYDPSGSVADLTHVDGGSSVTTAEAFLRSASGAGCGSGVVATGSCLFFHHTKFANGREGFSGAEIPFQTLRPSSMSSDLALSYYLSAGCSGSNCLRIKWNLLPGTAPLLQGVEIWAKQSNSDSGGGDKRCEDLAPEFNKVGVSTAPATGSFDFVPSGLTSSNWYQYRIYLCARSTAPGNPYVGRPINVNCGDSMCNRWNHLGWAPTGLTTINTVTSTLVSRKVYAGISAANPLASYFQTATPSGFAVNDELLISVVGVGGASSCGNFYGDATKPIRPGAFGFARILDIVSSGGGSGVYIEKGTLLDDMANSSVADATLQATATVGSNFCFATATKVNQYNDLTLASTGSLYPPSFTYGNTTGGVLAVRVNGTLDMANGSSFDVAAKGFPGGTGMSHGAGSTGDGGGVSLSSMAGGGANYGGGGGGYGRGGMQTSYGTAGSGESSYMNGNLRLQMGGGGGGGNVANGAAGGGAFILISNRVQIASGATAVINASGGSVSGSPAGGGGGGSIFTLAREISGGGALNLYADGGYADASSGGLGGGGSIDRLMCVNDSTSPVTFSSSSLKGFTGSNDDTGNPAQDGVTHILSPSDSSNKYLCRMSN